MLYSYCFFFLFYNFCLLYVQDWKVQYYKNKYYLRIEQVNKVMYVLFYDKFQLFLLQIFFEYYLNMLYLYLILVKK